jgi:Flp pilus assembly pilin Flp
MGNWRVRGNCRFRWRDDAGATAVEYGVMLGILLVMLVVLAYVLVQSW